MCQRAYHEFFERDFISFDFVGHLSLHSRLDVIFYRSLSVCATCDDQNTNWDQCLRHPRHYPSFQSKPLQPLRAPWFLAVHLRIQDLFSPDAFAALSLIFSRCSNRAESVDLFSPPLAPSTSCRSNTRPADARNAERHRWYPAAPSISE